MRALATFRQFLIALALAFSLGQVATASFAAGAPMLDAFGNPLCLSGMAPAQPADGIPHQSQDCCLASSNHTGDPLLAPNGPAFFGVDRIALASPVWPMADVISFLSGRSSTARAPPPLA